VFRNPDGSGRQVGSNKTGCLEKDSRCGRISPADCPDVTGRERPMIRRKDSTSPSSARGSAASVNTGRKESPGCDERTSELPIRCWQRPRSVAPVTRQGQVVWNRLTPSRRRRPPELVALSGGRRLRRGVKRFCRHIVRPHGDRWSYFGNQACAAAQRHLAVGFNGFAVSCWPLNLVRRNHRRPRCAGW
jgi:hypothetical protein